MQVIFVLLLCSAATVLGQSCGSSSCSSTECCIQPEDGDPYCQALGGDGEVCQPSGLTKTVACQCMSGFFCTMTNPDEFDRGTCMSRANTGERCGSLYCPSTDCCIKPTNEPQHCSPTPAEGQLCDKTKTIACRCPSGLYCVSMDPDNTNQGTCTDPDDVGPQCGNIYCQQNQCCVGPYNGNKTCQPYVEQGEVCETLTSYYSCPCINPNDICIPRTEDNLRDHTGVCIAQDNLGEQCERLYCTKEECCLEPGLFFYNEPPHCEPLAQRGQLCLPRGFNITIACPCAQGLNCSFSANVPQSSMSVEAGICIEPINFPNYGNYMQGLNGGINGGGNTGM